MKMHEKPSAFYIAIKMNRISLKYLHYFTLFIHLIREDLFIPTEKPSFVIIGHSILVVLFFKHRMYSTEIFS